MTSYKVSGDGREFIKDEEGEELDAYEDIAGVWTIGVGHTRKVAPGDEIDEATSDVFLQEDLVDAEQALANYVHVPLNQNEVNALGSLIFNIGGTQFRNSTLLRKLNAGDRKGAAEQFLVWNKYRKGEKLEVSKGLSDRRAREKKLFEKVPK